MSLLTHNNCGQHLHELCHFTTNVYIYMTKAIVTLNCGQRLLELCHITRNVYIWQETYKDIKRDLSRHQKGPIKSSNETYKDIKRDVQRYNKRPIKTSKETCTCGLALGIFNCCQRLVRLCHVKRNAHIRKETYKKTERHLERPQ